MEVDRAKRHRLAIQQLCEEEEEISDQRNDHSDMSQECEEEQNNETEGNSETFVVSVPTISEKPLHLQRVVEIDGFTYVRRACSGQGFQYFYCTHSHPKCKAGFRYDPKSRVCIPNSKKHHHPPGPVLQSQLKKNLQLVAFRMFVEKHCFEESRHIYTLLLGEIEKTPAKYPPLKDVSIKAIQNLKGQLAGENARNLLDPTLPLVLREIDGVNFLAYQSVRPILLMFATETSMQELSKAQMLFLQKIHIRGPVLKHVFCVYSVTFDSVIPCLWLAFETNDDHTWSTLQYIIRKRHKDPATWILPLKLACSKEFSDSLLRHCDRAMGIKDVYWNKVHKIVARIHDEALRKSFADELIGLATTEIHEISGIVTRLKQQARSTGAEAVSVMSMWDTKFSRTTLLWHNSNCCHNEAVSTEYVSQKQRPYQLFPDDQGVIRFIQKHYKDFHQTLPPTNNTDTLEVAANGT